jgi:hypothetical protein
MSPMLNPSTSSAYLNRLDTLTSAQLPRWGKMNASQMLAHCSEVLEVSCGKKELKAPWLIRLIGRILLKEIMKHDRMTKGSATARQYVIAGNPDFNVELERLKALIQEFAATSDEVLAARRHVIFGELTADQSRILMAKHLEHHFAQFRI